MKQTMTFEKHQAALADGMLLSAHELFGMVRTTLPASQCPLSHFSIIKNSFKRNNMPWTGHPQSLDMNAIAIL